MKTLPIIATALTLALAGERAEAQTIHACYVPKTGTVYRIQAPDAPDTCGKNHVAFSWTTGASAPLIHSTTHTEPYMIQPGTTVAATESCSDPQMVLISGGYTKLGPDTQYLEVVESAPAGGQNTWNVKVRNHGNTAIEIVVYAKCIKLVAVP